MQRHRVKHTDFGKAHTKGDGILRIAADAKAQKVVLEKTVEALEQRVSSTLKFNYSVSSSSHIVLQVYEALKEFFKDKAAFVFHGFEPRRDLPHGQPYDALELAFVPEKMETDFLVVLPDCTVIAIECKTTFHKEALRDARRQWKNMKLVLENYLGLGYFSEAKFVKVLCFEKWGPAKFKACASCPKCSGYLVHFSNQKKFLEKVQASLLINFNLIKPCMEYLCRQY